MRAAWRSRTSIIRFLGPLVTAALLGTLLPLVAPTPARAQEYTLGIDVSHHQGSINWQRVADSGHVFAFHKATEGATFTDNTYARNRAAAGDASIPFGAYHFARPDGGSKEAARADAIGEAEHFLSVAQPAPGDLLPVLDLEATGGLPQARLITWTQAWLDEIEASLDVKALIYSGPNFWQTNMGDTTTFAQQGFPLWIAHYTSASAPRTPAQNWNGEGWAFWQWTSCARIPGISGCADEDRFEGSDLSPYTIPGEPEPSPSPDPATPPSNESPPEIHGDTEVGGTMTATQGEWSGSQPQSYSYAWHRCEEDGTGCSAVLNGTNPSYEIVPADFGHRMRVTVTATNSAGSASQDSSPSEVVTDKQAPVVPRVVKPRRMHTLKSRLNVLWSRSEQDARYSVRYRSKTGAERFGDHQELVASTTERSTTLDARTGTVYCLSARATDVAGNTSDWGSEKCTTVPLDDRDLRASSSWARRSNRSFYLGTLTKTTRKTASLTARDLAGRDLFVVAQVCRGCGRVAVLLNGRRVGTVSMDARRTRPRQVLSAASFSRRKRGVVELVVISRGAPVKIDGLALS